MFQVPESCRLLTGPLASNARFGNNGAFELASVEPGWTLVMLASDGGGWEHVSVRAVKMHKGRTPTWKEMAFAKALCWSDEDVVIQYHPAKAEYVNNHPHVLHLWRPTNVTLPTPPKGFV